MYQCSLCTENKALKEAWGCDRGAGSPFVEDYKGIRMRYWRCPVKFIPRSLYEFMSEYSYHKNFPSAPMPDFSKMSVRFKSAMQYYESKYAEFLRAEIRT